MFNSIHRSFWIFLLALSYAPSMATAGAGGGPSGDLHFDFGQPFVIYDFSALSDCETVSDFGVFVTLCIDTNMVGDAKGKYTGTAALEFSGDIDGFLVGPASAKIKADEFGGKGTFGFSADGSVSIAAQSFATSTKVSCKGTIAPGGFYLAECKVGVKIQGLGSAREATAFSETLPGEPWSLWISVLSDEKDRIEGTASDTLGFIYTVKGKYDDKSDLSKLKATGDSDDPGSKGAKVQLEDLTSAGNATAKFKLGGHKADDIPVMAD